MLTFCGRCGEGIERGLPVFWIAVGPRLRPRCVLCADESVPADLPELGARTPITPTPKAPRTPLFASIDKFSSIGQLGRDWKERQAGREPGEDDT
jgi:hypothetical protein